MGVREFSEGELAAAMGRPCTFSGTAWDIARDVADRHGVDMRRMLSKSRSNEFIEARRELYTKLRAMGWSLKTIGLFAGRRDHSTVRSALQPQERKARRILGGAS